jgi:hypothetical protein
MDSLGECNMSVSLRKRVFISGACDELNQLEAILSPHYSTDKGLQDCVDRQRLAIDIAVSNLVRYANAKTNQFDFYS